MPDGAASRDNDSGFGNIRPMQGDSWIDFLNVVKYPPAMTFTLLTMGVNLILLWLFSRARGLGRTILRPLVVFGQAPLFFYVLHLFLYAGLFLLLTPEGTSLLLMYPVWLLGLLILFPVCLWYGRFKHRQPAGSLLRLFYLDELVGDGSFSLFPSNLAELRSVSMTKAKAIGRNEKLG